MGNTAYGQAVKAAAEETELKVKVFPQTCPWSLDEVLDDELWPQLGVAVT